MIVGVTGASGFIGGHLVRHLLTLGHTVRVLVRHSSRLERLKNLPLEYVYGEILDSKALVDFVDGLDLIIHCAGLVSSPVRQEMMAVNVEGTRRLLAACRQKNRHLSRFVFISSQEAAGVNPDRHAPLDESMSLRPITTYGLSKARAEHLVATGGLPFTILRPGGVFGPFDKDTRFIFETAAKRLHLKTLYPNLINALFIDNLLTGIVQAMNHPGSKNQSYYLSGKEQTTIGNIFEILQSYYGKPRLTIRVPRFVFLAVAAGTTALSAVTKQSYLFTIGKYKMLTAPNCTVSIAKARNDFGYQSAISLRDGLLKTAEWYRQNVGF